MKKKEFSKADILTIVKAIACFLFPFVLCTSYCLMRGKSVFSLFLPDSINNDCLYYYKLVEGTVYGWMPKGYFGFNESHAIIGTYAAWNPLILLPWVIWGKIFGWNYASPFLSNLFFVASSLTAMSFLAKPKGKDLALFFGMLFVFPSVPIHFLNALPESMMLSVFILFYAFAIRASDERGGMGNIIGMVVCSFFMTLVRPYMVLTFFLPWYYGKKGKKPVFHVGMILLAVLAVSGNFISGHFLTSEYFTPLYDLSLIKHIFTGKFADALRDIKYTAMYIFPEVWYCLKSSFTYGMTAGTQYMIAISTAAFLLLMCAEKEDKKNRVIYIFHASFVVLMLVAIVFLLKKANEGGRHLFIFAVTGIFLLCVGKSRMMKLGLVLATGLLMMIFLVQGGLVPTDYDVPFDNLAAREEVAYWDETFEKKDIKASKETGYDNTVIWVLWDDYKGERLATDVCGLYALPKGMGISCCEDYYVKQNIDGLKSRYIATLEGGAVDELCREHGFKEIGKTSKMVIFEKR